MAVEKNTASQSMMIVPKPCARRKTLLAGVGFKVKGKGKAAGKFETAINCSELSYSVATEERVVVHPRILVYTTFRDMELQFQDGAAVVCGFCEYLSVIS